MIVEYIRYRIDDARREAFEQAYQRAANALQQAEQCVDYELTRCTEDPQDYILRIRWTSAEDHLQGFRKGEHFAAFFAQIRSYVQDIEEMRHYEATPVAGRGGSTPTLYEWAGGQPAMERLFTRFYQRVDEDPLLAPVFADKEPDHALRVAAWLGRCSAVRPATAPSAAATVTWRPATWAAASPSSSGAGGSHCCWTPPTRWNCLPTPSSAPSSPTTWSGAPGWPCSTRARPRPRCRKRRCRAGTGASPRPTGADGAGTRRAAATDNRPARVAS